MCKEDWTGTKSSRSDILDEEVESWSTTWDEGGPAPCLDFGPVERLPPITREQVISASRAFKTSTCALSGVHPRHIGFLPAAAIDLLIVLLESCEEVGFLPPQAMLTFALIPKPTGGRRPIGWYQTIFRIWGAIRSPLVKQWERVKTSGLGFATDPGQSAIDVVWRHSLRGEIAKSSSRYFGCVLWDLQKCYEKIQHDRLIEAANKHGYPTGILRLTLASYRASRRILLNGLVSRHIYPNAGIIAGAFSATTELRLILLDTIKDHIRSFPKVHLNVYIDDLAFDTTQDDKHDMVEELQSAGENLAANLYQLAGLPIAQSKCAVLSNSFSAARSLRRALGCWGGAPTSAVRSLGVDFDAGARRRRKPLATRKSRYAKLALRRPRLRQLKKAYVPASGKVFAAGILPSVLFDCPVYGLFGNSLRSLRRETGSMLGVSGPKKSLDLALSFTTSDPEVITAKAVVFRFAKELWQASLSPELRDPATIPLGCLVSGMARYIEDNPLPPKHASGPLSALHKCLHNAGWKFVSPLIWITRAGTEVHLPSTSPKRIRNQFGQDVQEVVIHRSIVKIHMKSADTVESAQLLDNGLFFKPLRDLAKRVSKQDSRVLQAIVSNGIFTNSDLYNFGYNINPICRECNQAADTIYHRCFSCVHIETRAEIAVGETLFNEIIAAGSSSLRGTRCLFPEPIMSSHPAIEPVVKYINFSPGDSFNASDGKVYGDGSCLYPSNAPLSRAGFAIIQTNDRNEVLKGLYGTVPFCYPQTPLCSEFAAFSSAAALSKGVIYAGDCQEVLSCFLGGEKSALGANKLHACSWKLTRRFLQDDPGIASVVKVKAHRKIEDVVDQGDNVRDFWGNHFADQYAREGAELHLIEGEDVKKYKSARRDVVNVATHMIDTLKGLMLSRISPDGFVSRLPRGAAPIADQTVGTDSSGHKFHWQDDKWICAVCLFCTKNVSSVSRSKRSCVGSSPFSCFLGDNRGHKLWIAHFGNDLSHQIVYCSECWSYATTSPKSSKLVKQCCGPPTIFRPSVRHYLLRFKHPVSRVPFSKPFRFG